MKTILAFVIAILLYSSCSFADDTKYIDGVYSGSHSFVDVMVTIEGNKIANIEIMRHGGGGRRYEEMIIPLIDKIMLNQSTRIDAVTGATVSSENLLKAVDMALNQAVQD
jgi:NosR/NirI family transcriptional regulator, nitrous oxide reductase regulator